MVYLHGAFEHKGWAPFLDMLSETYTVYAPIHPGMGESKGIEHLQDLQDLILYYFDLLDTLKLNSVLLVAIVLEAW